MNSVLSREDHLLDSSSTLDKSVDAQDFSSALFLLVLLFIIFIGFLKKENHSGPRADKYSMEIKWSNEDEAYIVTVPELPGCRTHGSTYEEAVQQGKDAIESWIEASEAWGDPIPPPRVATLV
ncbi:MAG: hypothetical protein NVSMB38_35350 [Ktedonobacteraceae bacterium]